MNKKIFQSEIDDTILKVKNLKKKNTFVFALLTDTHLSDTGEDTVDNIKAVDEKVNFEFLLHMGDFATGGIPEKFTRRLIREEADMYKNSIKSKKLHITQGNHDGFRDETYKGQLIDNCAFDEKWTQDTSFIDTYENIKRPLEKPYYYVDYPEKKLRFIILCSYYYTFNEEIKEYKKYEGFDKKQIEWAKNDAFSISSGWTVFVFTHAVPLSELGNISPWGPSKVSELGGKEMCEVLLKSKAENGFELAGWFVGHFHGDRDELYNDIQFIWVGSQTAYIPQLWQMGGNGYFPSPRELGTVTQDLWDVVIVNTKEKKFNLVRFGAGIDREFSY